VALARNICGHLEVFLFQLIRQKWSQPIDAAALAVFRMMFGAVLLFESVNYGVFLCLDCMYRSSSMLFKYHYFEWVKLWPGFGLELQFLVMGICAIGIMLGFFYRAAMVIYTLCFSYLFLLDQALYLNHFYLVILICCIMVVLPANRLWSIDAKRNRAIASHTVPAWTRFLFVTQMEIVLLYAGIVKLNWDWLNLEPMRLWMTEASSRSFEIFQWLSQDPGIALASYGVILLHLVGAPLLLWSRTRLPVFLVYCVFHTINALVFNIGIFPWMTAAATLMFFEPGWPRQFARWLQTRFNVSLSFVQTMAAQQPENVLNTNRSAVPQVGYAMILFIVIWLLVQAVVPARNWFLPGDVAWNEAGHRFSWRMKLREKRGRANFYVSIGRKTPVRIDNTEYLNPKQIRTMACIPDLIWQYAQFLEQEQLRYQTSKGVTVNADEVKVYVDARCSLNTREQAPLINRLVDLTSIERSEPEQNWVLSLSKPLPRQFLPL